MAKKEKKMKVNKAREVNLGSGMLERAAQAIMGGKSKRDKAIDDMVNGIPQRKR